MPDAVPYAIINDVKVNKITKQEFDNFVAAGAITQEQIENEVWIFSDDNFLSAANLEKLNGLDLSAIAAAANVIEGITVNGEEVTPDEQKVVNITVPTLPALSAVATSGSYNDLTDKPTIPEGSCVLRIWGAETT